jgi:hypothetical protein
MNEINEIKIPKGVDRIAVKQHDDKVVIEFIPEKSEFKEGDFVYEDGRIMIVKNYPDNYYALIYPKSDMEPVYNGRYAPTMPLSSLSFRYATEYEKQLLIDALKKDGKRWNAEKLEIEDIPQPKFKAGDKVKIKDGISSKTHRSVYPYFDDFLDQYIGKVMTVKEYVTTCLGEYITMDEAKIEDHHFGFAEDWLEPCSDEPKKGDLAIFWDYGDRDDATIRLYDKKGHEYHYDNYGAFWANAIKFESKEQFEKVLRGEI